MIHISTAEFQAIMESAIDHLPKDHKKAIKNIAFFVRDEPNDDQKARAGVREGYLLLGLYEGVPLPQRLGRTDFVPDRITLFQEPIETVCDTIEELTNQIRHTVWHEVAHYFGLNHDDIRKLE